MDRPDADARRKDFGIAELKAGTNFYFAQDDNRSTGGIVYRMQIREIAPDRLVVETENIGAVRFLLLSLAGPGDLQTLYFLDRRTSDEWSYYSLARTAASASTLMEGHAASYINRAAALFRYFAALPTDQEPPASP